MLRHSTGMTIKTIRWFKIISITLLTVASSTIAVAQPTEEDKGKTEEEALEESQEAYEEGIEEMGHAPARAISEPVELLNELVEINQNLKTINLEYDSLRTKSIKLTEGNLSLVSEEMDELRAKINENHNKRHFLQETFSRKYQRLRAIGGKSKELEAIIEAHNTIIVEHFKLGSESQNKIERPSVQRELQTLFVLLSILLVAWQFFEPSSGF